MSSNEFFFNFSRFKKLSKDIRNRENTKMIGVRRGGKLLRPLCRSLVTSAETVSFSALDNETDLVEKHLTNTKSTSNNSIKVPKEDLLVRDLNIMKKDAFATRGNFVTQKFIASHSGISNLSLLRVNHFLQENKIGLLIDELDKILFETPDLLKQVQDWNLIFTRCQISLKLGDSAKYDRTERKRYLSNLTLKIVKLYEYLSLESLANSTILEKTLEILVQNNRVVQANTILMKSHLRRSSLKLLNLEIKISGNGVPETWTFPTGVNLKRDLNAKLLNHKIRSAAQCINLIKKSEFTPNLDTVNNLILVIGGSQNMKLLDEVIQSTWKLSTDEALTLDSRYYPNLDTLTNIVFSYAYNGEFLQGLQKINLFLRNYKFELNSNRFWLDVLNVCYISMEKSELKHDTFHGLWKLMQNYLKTPSYKLYSIRLDFLRQFNELNQILETLPEIRRLYTETNSSNAKILLKNYLTTILKLQSSKYLPNQSLKLLDNWCPDDNFRAMMDVKYQKFYSLYQSRMQKKMERENLNDIYEDEEDDDFALW